MVPDGNETRNLLKGIRKFQKALDAIAPRPLPERRLSNHRLPARLEQKLEEIVLEYDDETT